MNDSLILRRVIYGKDNTPMHLREYRLPISSYSAVGCINELINVFRKFGVKQVLCYDKDGLFVEQIVDFENETVHQFENNTEKLIKFDELLK